MLGSDLCDIYKEARGRFIANVLKDKSYNKNILIKKNLKRDNVKEIKIKEPLGYRLTFCVGSNLIMKY